MAVSILPRLVAVLYLRMSSDKQDASIPAQRSALIAYAKKRGYTILREYVDEGISGDSDDREAFLRLRQDAVTLRDFRTVLCWDGDRVSRHDFLDYGFWFKPLRDVGVTIETPEGIVDWDSLEGRIILAVQQEMRNQYLRNLSRNVSRGLLNAAKEGRGVGGPVPVGYQYSGDDLVVDPIWAPIIRRIFEEYLKADASLRSVALLLNSEGIRTKAGGLWGGPAISNILKNRRYCGDFVRFKERSGKFFAIKEGEIVPRSRSDQREDGEPIIIENHHEAIIPRKQFDAAQRKLAGQQKQTAHRTGYQYVFSGLLRCGDCTEIMGGQTKQKRGKRYAMYRCRTYTLKGKSACHCNSMAESRLTNTIARLLDEHYVGDAALDRIEQKLRKRLADDRRRRSSKVDLDRIRKRISELDKQIDKGSERIFSAPENLVETLYRKLDELRSERDRLRDQVQAAGRQDGGPDDDAVVEEALGYLRDLGRQIREAAPEDRRDLFRQIIARIELNFTHRQNGNKMEHPFSHGFIFLRPSPGLSFMLGIPRSPAVPAPETSLSRFVNMRPFQLP